MVNKTFNIMALKFDKFIRLLKFTVITSIIFACNITVFAQTKLMDSLTLALYEEYSNLDSAIKNPDDVIKLVLRKKKLKSFPSVILNFKNLQYLDLSKNSIKELPDSILKLINLQSLILSKTGLESIPNTIGQLKNLKYINFNQNEISRIPYSFGDLENLEVVDFWSNNLENFPETLKKLTKLKSMDLRNILIPQNQQDNLQIALPNTTIYFSPACKCNW